MLIEKKIMKKTHSGMIGLSSDSDSLSCNNGDENLGRGADEGVGRNNVLGALDFNLECDDEGNQIIVPPLPPPFHCSTMDKEIQQQAPVAGNKDEEDMTSPPALNALNGMKSLGSSIKSGKTKNSSNKNKERSSIAGAFAKLIEQGQPAGSSHELPANMSMMLMHQLDSMNRSMDKRERREEKRRRKERKRQKKCHPKKKRKKARKRAAYEGLEDHGGKAAGKYSSSSDSNSSNSDSSDSSGDGSSQSSNYGRGNWRQAGNIN
jgi:hypothetical protein